MSFTIKLQLNSSPMNKVGKNITDVISVTGYLRDGTSVIDPIFVIESSVDTSVVSGVNYCYIAQFGRYYYITDISCDVTGLWIVACHVDVLETYKTQIKAQTAVVARQENTYNMFLDDGWFMAYQDPKVQTKYFSVTDPFEQQEFILVLAGSA